MTHGLGGAGEVIAAMRALLTPYHPHNRVGGIDDRQREGDEHPRHQPLPLLRLGWCLRGLSRLCGVASIRFNAASLPALISAAE
jgi:hypothetical protein